MNKLALTLLAGAFFVGAASAATDVQVTPPAKSGTYYWLHPKLGMVKVDRATNAMIVGKRDKQRATGTAQGAVPSN